MVSSITESEIRKREGTRPKEGLWKGGNRSGVHPGRITAIEPAPGGAYSVTIDSTTVSFAARNLDQRGVIRDLTLWTIISNMDTGEV